MLLHFVSSVLFNHQLLLKHSKIWKLKKSDKFNLFERFEKIDEFNTMTSAMFNAYLISTLKFQFEKIDKFNNITLAMFNAYLILTLKFEKIKYFWEIKRSEKTK